MATDLTEVPLQFLLKEVQRRAECATKPEKRLVLIGEFFCEGVPCETTRTERCAVRVARVYAAHLLFSL